MAPSLISQALASEPLRSRKSALSEKPGFSSPHTHLGRLYLNAVILKVWKTATKHLQRENPPVSFPETVPQTGPDSGSYRYRDAEFWTCGFFPGNLYCLLERSVKYPQRFLTAADGKVPEAEAREAMRRQLKTVCRAWSDPLHAMSHRNDSHDLGFMIMPALSRDFELTGSTRSLESIVHAAESLASRYVDAAKAIRSWDVFVNNYHNFTSKEDCFLVIIDSMCNLDLLYYAAHHAGQPRLAEVATTHAHTIRRTHLREVSSGPGSGSGRYPQYATCHVANLCAKTGDVLKRLSAQGYNDDSTWARGQAWGILGFAQTYAWTKNEAFLETACGLAEHFVYRLETSPDCVEVNGVGRYVPLWDFDAPVDEAAPIRDTSAGMAAANGLLIISSALMGKEDTAGAAWFLNKALSIVNDTLALSYAQDTLKLCLEERPDGSAAVVAVPAEGPEQPFDALLRNATANYNVNWTDKYYDHGLVYADYYMLEFGNRLLQLGYM